MSGGLGVLWPGIKLTYSTDLVIITEILNGKALLQKYFRLPLGKKRAGQKSDAEIGYVRGLGVQQIL